MKVMNHGGTDSGPGEKSQPPFITATEAAGLLGIAAIMSSWAVISLLWPGPRSPLMVVYPCVVVIVVVGAGVLALVRRRRYSSKQEAGSD